MEFSGSPEQVLQSMNSFLAREIPSLDLARKLALNFSAKDLVEKFQDYIRMTPEGPRIVAHRKLSDKELVATQLIAQKIAFETGKSRTPSLSLAELQALTALVPKSLSSRLSELAKTGYVIREENTGGSTSFKVSTQGVSWLADTLSKKARKPQGSF